MWNKEREKQEEHIVELVCEKLKERGNWYMNNNEIFHNESDLQLSGDWRGVTTPKIKHISSPTYLKFSRKHRKLIQPLVDKLDISSYLNPSDFLEEYLLGVFLPRPIEAEILKSSKIISEMNLVGKFCIRRNKIYFTSEEDAVAFKLILE